MFRLLFVAAFRGYLLAGILVEDPHPPCDIVESLTHEWVNPHGKKRAVLIFVNISKDLVEVHAYTRTRRDT
jgi:hypothetical protein